MRSDIHSALLSSFVACSVLAGCAVEAQEPGGGEGRIQRAEEALLSGNALTANALTANALMSNALTANALTANALTANALAAIQDPGPSGALARDSLRYIVSCALGADAAFDFSWTDAGGVVHSETFPGQLGLAASWKDGSIEDEDAAWVSSCLAARVNYYGVPVAISVRGKHKQLKKVDDVEVDDFPWKEGAFWGNLFIDSPAVYACYSPDQVDHARANLRDCAAGHVSAGGIVQGCGPIQIVGSCDSVCGNAQPKYGYHSQCDAGTGAGGEGKPITVFLD